MIMITNLGGYELIDYAIVIGLTIAGILAWLYVAIWVIDRIRGTKK